MCAIFGGFNKDKLIELAKLNSHRGNFSYSITAIDVNERTILQCIKGFGPFVPEFNHEGAYYICHIQAPTSSTEQDLRRVHPSVIETEYESGIKAETFLWHNGVLKPSWFKNSPCYDVNLSWDTAVLHREFLRDYMSIENVDGQFSCVFFDFSGLVLFRNSEAPMFVDDELNISSTKFEGSRPTEPGIFYEIIFVDKRIFGLKQFKCKSSAYYIKD